MKQRSILIQMLIFHGQIQKDIASLEKKLVPYDNPEKDVPAEASEWYMESATRLQTLRLAEIGVSKDISIEAGLQGVSDPMSLIQPMTRRSFVPAFGRFLAHAFAVPTGGMVWSAFFSRR